MKSSLLLLFLASAVVVAMARAPRRHDRQPQPQRHQPAMVEMAAAAGVGAARPNGYGVSGGDWMNKPSKHHGGGHHRAARWAPPPPPAHGGAAAPAGDLLPIMRTPNGYSMPQAQRDSGDRQLTMDNTPIARGLGGRAAMPSGMAMEGEQQQQQPQQQQFMPQPPPPPQQQPQQQQQQPQQQQHRAPAAGKGLNFDNIYPKMAFQKPQPPPTAGSAHHHHSSHRDRAVAAEMRSTEHEHANPQADAGGPAGQAYSMPKLFADTPLEKDPMAGKARDPDAFFGMQHAPTKIGMHNKHPKDPLYATGEETDKEDVDRWEAGLTKNVKINTLHRQLLAKAHGKVWAPRPVQKKKKAHKAKKPAKPHHKKRAAAARAAAAAAARMPQPPPAPQAPARASSLLDAAEQSDFAAFSELLGAPLDASHAAIRHEASKVQAMLAAKQAEAEQQRAEVLAQQQAQREAEHARFLARKRASVERRERKERQRRRALKVRMDRMRRAALRQKRIYLARLRKAKRAAARAAKRAAKAAAQKAKLLSKGQKKSKKAGKKSGKKGNKKTAKPLPPTLTGGAVPLPNRGENPFLNYAAPPTGAAGSHLTPVVPMPPARAPISSLRSPMPAPLPASSAAPLVPRAMQPPIRTMPMPMPVPMPVRRVVNPDAELIDPSKKDYAGEEPVFVSPSETATAEAINHPLPRMTDEAYPQPSPPPIGSDSESEETPSPSASMPAIDGAVQMEPIYENGDSSTPQAAAVAEDGDSAPMLELLQTSSSASRSASYWDRDTDSSSSSSEHEREHEREQPSPARPGSSVNPVLSCVLANCSVPYLGCMASAPCSKIFDCLQGSVAPLADCVARHSGMDKKAQALFQALSECEQHHCFPEWADEDEGEATEQPPQPPRESIPVHEEPREGEGEREDEREPAKPVEPRQPEERKPEEPLHAASEPLTDTTKPVAAPATATAAPVAAKPNTPASSTPQQPEDESDCQSYCARKCNGALQDARHVPCLHACTVECFKRHFIVNL